MHRSNVHAAAGCRSSLRVRLPAPLVAAFLALPMLTRPAGAWDQTGHKTVARVAWSNMSDQARRAVIALLLAGPPAAQLDGLRPPNGDEASRNRDFFEAASTWADLVRGPGTMHDYNRPTWHYADFFWKEQGGAIVDLPSMGPEVPNAAERLAVFERSLRGSSDADSTRAIGLAWILHLVGDLHQPLHCSSRVTAESPTGDRGGNALRFTQNINLHSYWDGIVSFSIQRLSDEGEAAYIDRLAASAERRYPRSSFGVSANSRDYDAWGREGLRSAKRAYTGLSAGTMPSDAYRDATLRTSERALALAGYRLASLLNSIFK